MLGSTLTSDQGSDEFDPLAQDVDNVLTTTMM
jgi:hypothetical protein